MALCVVMVGLPASGKSTKAKELAISYNANIHSSDSVRKQLYGDENIQGDGNKVFSILYKNIKEDLVKGQNAIIDATNTSYKNRKNIFENLRGSDCVFCAHVMRTPYKECLVRNSLRDRKVPEDVMEKFYHSYQIPFFEEGFDYIFIDNYFVGSDKSKELFSEMVGFDQKTPYHKFTLDRHCELVAEYMEEEFKDNIPLQYACLLHDYGKLFTQREHKDGNGRYCYYSHENVGCYKMLENIDKFAFSDQKEYLKFLFYICYHMVCFSDKNSDFDEKNAKKYGKNNYLTLKKFNYFDRLASGRENEK